MSILLLIALLFSLSTSTSLDPAANQCTFHATITASCLNRNVQTSAQIPVIHTPSRDIPTVADASKVRISNGSTWYIPVVGSAGVQDVLSVTQDRADGVVSFGWKYAGDWNGVPGYAWADDEDGAFGGRFGCVRAGDGWVGERLECESGYGGEWVLEMDCFFECL